MRRDVSSHLELHAHAPADLVLSVAVAESVPTLSETLTVLANGEPCDFHEVHGRHGTRLHRIAAPAGDIVIDYEAEIDGLAPTLETEEIDIIEYRRPSRYAESDTLAPTAFEEFEGLEGKALLDAVSSWVGVQLAYVSGSSQPTDGAVATLLARQGVCRDFAHLSVAMLRAREVPARLVSVYAPGLAPMDFHAVAEAYVDGQWCLVDATTLAPRSSMVRIATGVDAAETAFLSQYGASVDLYSMAVLATVDALPEDDVTQIVELR